jgi:hypothetical protein
MQPKFNLGDRVRKTRGSEWQGRVVGTYSTTLTPEGYAVESEAHPGSVQIYPASALEIAGDPSMPLWDGWIKFDRESKDDFLTSGVEADAQAPVSPCSGHAIQQDQDVRAETIRAVIARLEQGFGHNSAPVFVIKQQFGGE